MRACWLGLALLGLTSAAHAATGPMTFEEVMKDQRTFDGASFSPDGRHLLYAVRRHGTGADGLMVPVGSREAWIVDLDRGSRVRIGGPESGGYLPSPCSPWARDGRGVALLTDRGGSPRLGFYDLRRRRLRLFKPLPGGTCPTWVGATLVYPAPTAQAPIVWSNRQRVAFEAGRWSAAWSGRSTETTVHSSNPDFPAPPPPPAGLAFADPATGRSGLIAEGDFIDLTPSPDGHMLAVIRLGPVDPNAINIKEGRRGQLELYRIDAHGGRRIARLAGYDVGRGGLAWSPDGQRLLVGGTAPARRDPELFVLALGTLSVTPVALPPGVRFAPIQPGSQTRFLQLGWIGGRPAFIAGTPGAKRPPSDAPNEHGAAADLGFQLFVTGAVGAHSLTDFATQSVMRFASTSDGDGLVVSDGTLWRVHPGAPPRRMTPDTIAVTGLAELRGNADGPFVPAVAADRAAITTRGPDGRRRLMVVDVATPKAPLLDLPARQFAGWSPALRSAALVRYTGWSSGLQVIGAHAGRAATLNPTWRDRPLGEVHAITYEAGGRRLKGWVITPPGRHGPTPAIVWIYGGQLLSDDPPFEATPGLGPAPVFDGQLWAAQGYAVIYPSTPIGRGATTDVPGALADAAVAAVDAAAEAGWVDPNRVAIVGHSFGGFSAAAVLSRRSGRFRAGVAMSGIYDFATAWGSRAPSEVLTDAKGGDFTFEMLNFVEQGQIGLEAPPWQAPDAYLRASPLYNVETIRTPLLLTVGDLDLSACDLLQSERFYAALRRAGNPAVLVRYWGEGHVRSDGGAARDEWRRVSAWLDHYLKGAGAAPPPNPAAASASGAPRIPPTPPKARSLAAPPG